MIKFREKDFSNYIVNDAIKGASIGATAGALASGRVKKVPFFKEGKMLAGAGAIIGAALGALVGTARQLNEHFNRKGADNRLMAPILRELNKKYYREDQDYTRDPKKANSLGTKVCLVISSDGSDFKMLVNTADDPELRNLSRKLSKNIPAAQVSTNFASNKYNEIQISTVRDVRSNLNAVLSVVDGFIQAGYPVYLVEVG